MNGNKSFDSPPVRVGEELDVTVESVGSKGDGIAKKGGFVIFVPGTQQGDKVRVKINKVLRNMAFSEVVGSASEETAEEQPEEIQTEPEPKQEEEQPEEESMPEPNPQDSEDFGEDLEEEKQ
jgi:predicted RNA-binding protein with TRAM domain